MSKKIAILILLVFLPTIASASLTDLIFRNLNIPGGYSIKDLVYLYVIPFVGAYAITLGLLTKLGIFDTTPNINKILSLLFGLALLYTGTMLRIAQVLYSWGGFIGTVGFFILFVIGLRMYGKKKIYATKAEGGWRAQYADAEKSVKDMKQNQKNLQESQKKLDFTKARLRDIQSKIERMRDSPEAKKRFVGMEAKIKQEEIDLKTKIDELKAKVNNAAQAVAQAAEQAKTS
jgi:hypothetical protein